MALVRLLNFDEYIRRSGVKNPTWFCMDVSFLTRTEHFEVITPDAVVVFVYLAGECMKLKGAEIDLKLRHAALYCMMDAERILQAIEILKSVHLVYMACAESAQNLCTKGKEREGREGEETRKPSVPSEPAPTLFPALKAQAPEVEDSRTYDVDHETVTVPEKERPLPNIARLWNQHAEKELSRVLACTGTRRKNAVNRWKENPSDEFWSDVIWKINASDFLLGKTPRGTWKATLDWLLKPGNADKVREGQYDNRPGPGGGGPGLSYFARTRQGGTDGNKQ